METIGIQPGDKVLLISENGRKPVRCLALDSKKQLPTKTMNEYFPEGRGPLLEDEDLRRPWVTLDRQTRIAIGAEPWEPIIVGRDPRHALASELGVVAMGLAVSALGGAIEFCGELVQKVADGEYDEMFLEQVQVVLRGDTNELHPVKGFRHSET